MGKIWGNFLNCCVTAPRFCCFDYIAHPPLCATFTIGKSELVCCHICTTLQNALKLLHFTQISISLSMGSSQQPQDLRQIYHHIIDDVVAKMKPGFLQESVDE